ncbi:MAG TPA: hypothetical protein VIQ23_02775 [Hanamia sp.]
MDHVQQPRRKVIEIGVVGFCTSLFASLPKISFAKPAFNNHKGIVVHEEEGTHILSRRKVPITIRISKYAFTEKKYGMVYKDKDSSK